MEEKKSSALAAIIAASVLRLAVAGWLGGAALFTFILTPTLFRTLNRDQAGTIVGYLFPGYFRWGLVCGVLALAVLALTKFTRKRRIALVLIGMLAITTIQAFIIEPRAVALKRQIPSFETTSADHPLRVQFRTLHGISAAGNLSVIGGGVVLVLLL